MVTDPIGDFIIRLKNGSDAKKPIVEVPYSKFVENVARTLKASGYVDAVDVQGKLFNKTIFVTLRYFAGTGARIHGVERVSKPSRRVYQRSADIRGHRSGFGSVVLSTPKGVLVGDDARRQKVGGEVLFKIW